MNDFARILEDAIHTQELTSHADMLLQFQESNAALRAHAKNLVQSDLALHDVEHRLREVANHVPALIGYWNRELRAQ